MKCVSLLTIFFVSSTASTATTAYLRDNDVDRHWSLFKAKYGKHYSGDEEYFRKATFVETLKKVTKHNIEADLGLHSWRKGVNKFADLTREEFNALYKGFKMGPQKAMYIFENSSVVLPTSVDWRKQGLVNPVKDQGKCGSCWAFSAVASLEGQHAKKTGKLVSLSEQNLVDCSWDEGNAGCGGGFPDYAFEYIKKNNGIDTEESYPYKAKDEQCHFDPSNVGATLTGYVDIKSGSEKSLQEATAKIGPISVCIDADDNFQTYQSGIFDDRNCSSILLNHAVAVVGYGTEDGQDYWIVRNSWGADWGENGYIRMSRNKDNQCGIATKASYPIV